MKRPLVVVLLERLTLELVLRLLRLLKDSGEQFLGLDNLKYLVLDEFDQLLNETIIPDVKQVSYYYMIKFIKR